MEKDMLELLSDLLQAYLNKHNKHKPSVYIVENQREFPLVVMREINNTKSNSISGKIGLENHSNMTYELDIYAVDINDINNITIARSIQNDIDVFFSSMLGLNRIYASPTSNIDQNVYRVLMRYTGIYNNSKGLFF